MHDGGGRVSDSQGILKSCAQTDSSLVTAPRFMCGNMFIVVKAESSSRFMSLSSGNALEFPVQI